MSQHLSPALDQLIDRLADRIAEQISSRLQTTSRSDPGAATSPWMNITNAARYLDLPKQRLYKLTAAGAIPHYKHDGRLLFHRTELDTWLSQHAEGDRPAGRPEPELC